VQAILDKHIECARGVGPVDGVGHDSNVRTDSGS
jgi:hypothetical protein